MKKRYLLLTLMLMISSLYSSLNIGYNEYNNLPSPDEANKIYKLYIDKKYPKKVKTWKDWKDYQEKQAEKYTYLDKSTNLMWQDEPYTAEKGSWQYAKNYCNNLSLAGYNNWYLPNKNQLKDLYNKKNRLKNVTSSDYWSSSSYASTSSDAWYVYFSNGYTNNYNKTNSLYVRCVRGRQ